MANARDIFLALRPICEERSGSVVECLTRDQGVAGLSLTGCTVLCLQARHFKVYTLPSTGSTTQEDPSDMTEKKLTGT